MKQYFRRISPRAYIALFPVSINTYRICASIAKTRLNKLHAAATAPSEFPIQERQISVSRSVLQRDELTGRPIQFQLPVLIRISRAAIKPTPFVRAFAPRMEICIWIRGQEFLRQVASAGSPLCNPVSKFNGGTFVRQWCNPTYVVIAINLLNLFCCPVPRASLLFKMFRSVT